MRRTAPWRWIAIAVVTVLALGPIIWGLATSLKPASEALSSPPHLIPKHPTLQNYASVLFHTNSMQLIGNTLIVGLGAVVLSLVIALHAAYAASRLEFRLKRPLLGAILVLAAVPGIAVLPGLYIVAQRSGLYDSYAVLILVFAAWRLPLLIWLLQGFVSAVPRELEESAHVDGCGRLGTLYRIIVPLTAPGMVAAALIVFAYVWNDFLFAVTLTISSSRRTIQVGLYQFVNEQGIQWAHLMAYTIIASLPVIVLFVLLQRKFVQGLTAGALKG